MNIYLARHAETEWNVKRVMQGWKDSLLTEKGVNNARKLANRLKNIKFDMIFSSPSDRAYNTAKILNTKNKKIIVIEDLKELGFGCWEGVEKNIIEKKYPTEIDNFWNNPNLYQPIDGESFEELYRRVENVMFNRILKLNCKNILIVSHTVFIRVFFLIIKNKPLENLWENCALKDTGLSIIDYTNKKFTIELEWDTSHC